AVREGLRLHHRDGPYLPEAAEDQMIAAEIFRRYWRLGQAEAVHITWEARNAVTEWLRYNGYQVEVSTHPEGDEKSLQITAYNQYLGRMDIRLGDYLVRLGGVMRVFSPGDRA